MWQRTHYSFLISLRNKEMMLSMFSLFILCTFFIFLTGTPLGNTREGVGTIPVALVGTSDFVQFLEQDPQFELHSLDWESAMAQLDAGNIAGIFDLENGLELTILQSGIPQEILRATATRFLRMEQTRTQLPDFEEGLWINESLSPDADFVSQDISMTLLFLSIFGISGVFQAFKLGIRTQSHLEAVGNRRLMAGISPFQIVLSDILGVSALYFGISLLALAFFRLVLQLEELQFTLYFLAPLLILSVLGATFGAFFAFFLRGKVKTRKTIMETLTVAFGALAGVSILPDSGLLRLLNPTSLFLELHRNLLVDNFLRYAQLLGIWTVVTALLLLIIQRRATHVKL